MKLCSSSSALKLRLLLLVGLYHLACMLLLAVAPEWKQPPASRILQRHLVLLVLLFLLLPLLLPLLLLGRVMGVTNGGVYQPRRNRFLHPLQFPSREAPQFVEAKPQQLVVFNLQEEQQQQQQQIMWL